MRRAGVPTPGGALKCEASHFPGDGGTCVATDGTVLLRTLARGADDVVARTRGAAGLAALTALVALTAGLRFRLGLAAAGTANSAVTNLLTERLCRFPERTKVRNKLLVALFMATISCCHKVYPKTRPGLRAPALIAADQRCIDSHTFNSRLADTGIGVRSSCANSDTRNSSSIQRNSTIFGSVFLPADLSLLARWYNVAACCHSVISLASRAGSPRSFSMRTFIAFR